MTKRRRVWMPGGRVCRRIARRLLLAQEAGSFEFEGMERQTCVGVLTRATAGRPIRIRIGQLWRKYGQSLQAPPDVALEDEELRAVLCA